MIHKKVLKQVLKRTSKKSIIGAGLIFGRLNSINAKNNDLANLTRTFHAKQVIHRKPTWDLWLEMVGRYPILEVYFTQVKSEKVTTVGFQFPLKMAHCFIFLFPGVIENPKAKHRD